MWFNYLLNELQTIQCKYYNLWHVRILPLLSSDDNLFSFFLYILQYTTYTHICHLLLHNIVIHLLWKLTVFVSLNHFINLHKKHVILITLSSYSLQLFVFSCKHFVTLWQAVACFLPYIITIIIYVYKCI